MPTQLAPLMPLPPGGLIDIEAFKAEIVAELHQQILAGIQVHVAAPQIGSPDVRIDPQITVEPADANVSVTIPGIEALASQLAQVNNLLGQVVMLLGQQVTKRVTHNAEGRITEVVETRG